MLKTRLILLLLVALIATLAIPPFAAHAHVAQHGSLPGQWPQPHEARPALTSIPNPSPIGTDPLTEAEVALAQRIAAGRTNAPPPQRVQLLMTERHEAKKGAPLASDRRADVIFYDYANDQVIRVVVNLRAQTVEATHLRPGAAGQPLVAAVEAEAALAMILAHPTLAADFQQAFLQASGQFLVQAGQVQAQGILFVPGASEDVDAGALAKVAGACRQHRCIQLFVRAKTSVSGTNGVIDASNVVVDLSAGQLLWAGPPFRALILEGDAKRPPAPKQPDAEFVCAAGNPVVVTMTIGTRWGLCWAHDADRGLMLSQISFAAQGGPLRLILSEAALAQVVVTDDDGATRRYLLTDSGLPLASLTASDCPQGTLLKDASGAAVACQSVQPRGYAWRGSDQIQGQSLTLFAVSQTGDEAWVHQWVLDDDGSMHPMLGVRDAPSANRAIAAHWRLNVDLGGSADDVVEQFDYVGETSSFTRTQRSLAFTRETSSTLSPELQRFWRIKDNKLTNSAGQPASYQIVPQLISIYRDSVALTQNDVYVTNNKSCEQFASHNPTANGCGAQVSDFVNDEPLDEASSDVVVWYGTTWHQTVAKEDEAQARTHWQGFGLLPRDWLDGSPLVTRAAASPEPTALAAPLPNALNCSATYQITQRFANGAAWEMCWEPRAGYGYRLNQIAFTPAGGDSRLVLNALHVALMFVPYDDGGPRYRDTSLGQQLALLTADECPNGLLLPGDVLCLVRGLNGEGFVVYGYFNVANYYYVIQFGFNDDGSIAPALGATGSLQRFTRDASTGWPLGGLMASNHNHWVMWRMDFDLDGAADDTVKQFDFARSATGALTSSVTTLITETQTQNALTQMRFWRVYAHASPRAMTYELEPSVTDSYRASESFTQHDFYVTQNHADEALVSDAFGLASFVNGERVTDAVAWYGVNFHHVPRAEDDERMPVHWQGFVLRLQDRGLVARWFMPLVFR